MALTAMAAPADAQAVNEAINSVYARLAQARTAHDVAGMGAEFPAHAILVDARPGAPLMGSELVARLQPQAARLKEDKAKVVTAYRIERRSISGDVAVDAGYMRMAINVPDGRSMLRYSRFMTTLRRDADGIWRIIGDASMPADEAAWNTLTRQPGLHYDA